MTIVTYIIAALGLFWAALGLFNLLLLPEGLGGYAAIIANLVAFVVPGLLVVLLAIGPVRRRPRSRVSQARGKGARPH
jgi:hypothetical protein